jgi:tetratricopeptide (TPR) repeat protein
VHQELAIQAHMKKAQAALEKEQIDEAIEQWVQVLDIEVDHIEALGNAVRHLSRQKYLDDAREITWNAINAGTTHPSVYMTAIGIAERQGNPGEADDLRLKLVQLPEANEQMVVKTFEHFIGQGLTTQAVQALDYALPLHPKSQKLLVQRAQLAQDMSLPKEALQFYERAAQLGTRTPEGKLADEQLLKFTPRLSDKERGSIWIAVREAFGFGFVYLLLGWQDAGLNLVQLGTGRLLGVILGIIGGYFVISATSSPQQRPLAKWLGGKVPEPTYKQTNQSAYDRDMAEPETHTELPILPVVVRIIFGLIGVIILIGAFALVFSTALNLLVNPNPTPFHIPTLQELLEEAEQAMR